MATSAKIRPNALFVMLLLLYSLALNHAAFGGNQLPSSVVMRDQPDGRSCFGISGLYGDQEMWAHTSNQVARMFDIFTETDSLYIDVDTGLAWLFTRRTIETVPDLVNWLASYNGFVPTWTELVLRDREGADFDRDMYEVIARKDVEVAGIRHYMEKRGEENSVILRFYDNPYRGPSIATYELRISEATGQIVNIAFSETDSVTSDVLYSHDSYRAPDSAAIEFRGNHIGVAELNPTTAHCKGHMRYALRVFDSNGACIWLAEEDLQGALGVWARDFDGNGASEILVLANDHGRARLLVFGEVRQH